MAMNCLLIMSVGISFEVLRMLADETRLRILNLLAGSNLNVAELQSILGMGQSRVSSQLSQLRSLNLVSDMRQGKNVMYGLNIDAQLAELLQAASADLASVQGDRLALERFLQQRQLEAQRQYELWPDYGLENSPGKSWKAFAAGLVNCLNLQSVADLGCGSGRLARMFAYSAKQVIGVDINAEAVEEANRLAARYGIGNLSFKQGEIQNPPIEAGSMDLVIISQALHHVEEPQIAINSAARIMRSGGQLIILDLLSHNFSEAGHVHGDKHFGFSDEQLRAMLTQAGLHNIRVAVVDKEQKAPYFETILATARK